MNLGFGIPRARAVDVDIMGNKRAGCKYESCHCQQYRRLLSETECNFCRHHDSFHDILRQKRPSRGSKGPSVCKLPGCNQQTFFDQHKGIYHDYCSRSHAQQGVIVAQQRQQALAAKEDGTCGLLECREVMVSDPLTGIQRKYCCDAHQELDGARQAYLDQHQQPSPAPAMADPMMMQQGPINMPIQTRPTAVPPHTINFYNRGEPYYEFTNFFERVIPIEGKDWPTSEHYFQAGKFPDRPDLQEKIRSLPTPRDAFQFARQYDHLKRKDWEQAKQDIMYRAVSHKFVMHGDLGELLMATGTARLVEHTVNDRCWGDGGDGTGENRLGQMLEKIRSQLFERFQRTPVQAAPAPAPVPSAAYPSYPSQQYDPVYPAPSYDNTAHSTAGDPLGASRVQYPQTQQPQPGYDMTQPQPQDDRSRPPAQPQPQPQPQQPVLPGDPSPVYPQTPQYAGTQQQGMQQPVQPAPPMQDPAPMQQGYSHAPVRTTSQTTPMQPLYRQSS